MRAWIAGLLGMVAAPAMAADQFDLICTGSKTPTRYRVDLTRGETCEETCDRIWKMGPASSGELKLIDKAPILRGDLEERATVNRVTGEDRYMNRLSSLRPIYCNGACQTAPFSGFPAAKF